MTVRVKVSGKPGLLGYPSLDGKDKTAKPGDEITVTEETAVHLEKHGLGKIMVEKPAYKVEPPAPVDVKVTTKKR